MSVLIGAAAGWLLTRQAPARRDWPGLLLLAGGLPVKEGEEVIGAIGIGGAPGGHLDEACAQQAIDGMNKS